MGDIDPDFDRRFLNALTAGRNDDILALTDAEIDAAGSSTCEIRTWVLLAGAFAGRPFEEIMYEPIAGFGTGCAQCVVRAVASCRGRASARPHTSTSSA